MYFSHYIMHTIQYIIKCEQDIMTMMNQMFFIPYHQTALAFHTVVCMFSFNPIMVDNYAAFFNCRPAARALDSMMAPGFNWCFSFAPFDALGSLSSGAAY